MDVTADGVHSAHSAAEAKAPHATADTLGKPIGEKGANDVASEFEKHVEFEHDGMVALIGEHEKTGKPGYSARMAGQPSFPAFAILELRGMVPPLWRMTSPSPSGTSIRT